MPNEKLRQIQRQLTDSAAAKMDIADERKSARFHRGMTLRLAFIGAVVGLDVATSHIKPPGPLLGLALTFASAAGGAWLWFKLKDRMKACDEKITKLSRESSVLARQMRVEAFKPGGGPAASSWSLLSSERRQGLR